MSGEKRGKAGALSLAAAWTAAAATMAGFVGAALRAPVVLWSDSRIDLDLARERWGFLAGVIDRGGPMHPVKPLFILFLRAMLFFADPARAAVVAQSILLGASLVATSAYVGRRRGASAGWTCGILFVTALSVRDAASAVMPEALTIALLLPIVAVLILETIVSSRMAAAIGFAIGALFLVRSNAGVAAIVLALAAVSFEARPAKLAAGCLAGFLAVVLAAAGARMRAPHSPARSGVTTGLVTSSLDYGWPALASPWPDGATPREVGRAETRFALSRWGEMRDLGNRDVRRQWMWRLAHGTLGSDYYDARWCPAYRRIDEFSRELRPILSLAAIALVLGGLFAPGRRKASALGLLLLLLVTAQNLAIGSLPRFGLPYLLPLWLLGLASARRRSLPYSAIVLALLITMALRFPGIADREWGSIEKGGVVLVQKIPRGSMKSRSALHIRIASLTGTTGARLTVTDDRGQALFSSTENRHPERPDIVFSLPADLRARNETADIELRFVSSGPYDATNFYVFPVIPRPWSSPARREGNAGISPSTGIEKGGLDWW